MDPQKLPTASQNERRLNFARMTVIIITTQRCSGGHCLHAHNPESGAGQRPGIQEHRKGRPESNSEVRKRRSESCCGWWTTQLILHAPAGLSGALRPGLQSTSHFRGQQSPGSTDTTEEAGRKPGLQSTQVNRLPSLSLLWALGGINRVSHACSQLQA